MKQLFLAASLIMIASTATFAQTKLERKEAKVERREIKKEGREERRAERMEEVSDLTKNQFAQDFPDATNVRFEKTKNFDEVSFMDGNRKVRAYYDIDSKLVGTTERKQFSDLPENAQKKIQEKYGDYNVQAVIMFDDNEDNDVDMILYGSVFDDADNYFVELTGPKKIVLKVDLAGDLQLFKELK